MSSQQRAARNRSALLLAAAIIMLGSACETLLGIGDRSLDPELGGDAEAGSVDATNEARRDGAVEGAVDAQVDTAVDESTANEAGAGTGVCTASVSGPCVMVSGLDVAHSIVSDSSRVYWSEWGSYTEATGAVKSCPLAGCGAGPLVYVNLVDNPADLAIDAQSVYWGTSWVHSIDEAGIWSCPVSGCPAGGPKKLAPGNRPSCVAVSATDVYWFDEGTAYHVPKGGAPSATPLFAVGSSLAGPGRCTLDSSSFYVMDGAGNVYRVPLSGGVPILMVQGSANVDVPLPITLDANTVYFSTGTAIARVPKTAVDASAGIPIVPNLLVAVGLFLDPVSFNIYWVDMGTFQGSDGTLGKVNEDGGIAVLSGGLPRPFDLTVRGEDVFWLSNTAWDAGAPVPNTGALWRQPK
jgi:hypothetical protein